MKQEPLIVYWSPCYLPDIGTTINLLAQPPQPFWKTMPKYVEHNYFGGENLDNGGNYRACKAAQEYIKNVFVIKAPETSTIELSSDYVQPLTTEISGPWRFDGATSLKNSHRIEYDYSWLFFCEEPLLMKVTPPYMHKTTAATSGFISSGSFDIGRWFRPVNASFHLWPNINSITVTEEEPLMYIEFFTNRNIILKQFELIDSIKAISRQAVNFKRHVKNESMGSLYERFTRTNRHKHLIKLIKCNLTE